MCVRVCVCVNVQSTGARVKEYYKEIHIFTEILTNTY